MAKKTAMVTGAKGQDGFYLTLFLKNKNYDVIKVDKDNLDIGDSLKVFSFIKKHKPDEIYNLAAQSHVAESFKKPVETIMTNSLGAINLLDSLYKINPDGKFFQASSSTIYLDKDNPYVLSKTLAHEMVKIYREKYGMFAVNGILYNHESPKRGLNFITQKVTYAAACAKLGIKTSEYLNEEGEPIFKDGKVALGNLEAKRDWGFAGDYIEAMWKMLQVEKPDDYIIATGETHTIKELCEEAFKYVGLNYEDFVVVDQRFVRSTETGPLVGNPAKAKEILGWEPKTKFKELVAIMVGAHLARLK